MYPPFKMSKSPVWRSCAGMVIFSKKKPDRTTGFSTCHLIQRIISQRMTKQFFFNREAIVKETCGRNNVLIRHRLRTYNEQYSAVYLLFVTAKCRHISKAAGIAYAELSGDSGKKEIGFRFCQM